MDKAAPTFVGIDVPKRRLDVHLRPSGESFAIDHGEEEVTALIEHLVALEPTLVVLEATGGMEVRLAATAISAFRSRKIRDRARQIRVVDGVEATDAPRLPQPTVRIVCWL